MEFTQGQSSSTSGYSDNLNKITRSIFVWIDILGYSGIVEDEDKYDDLIEKLKNFRRSFEEIGLDSKILSDGLVLEIQVKNHKGNKEKLNEIFYTIGKKQIEFIISNKLLLRGGIAVGTKLEFGENEHDYVSNGLARSYNLESKGIDWPVIATNKSNLGKINNLFTMTNDELYEFYGLSHSFNKNGDDIYFIDYLYNDDPLNPQYEDFILNNINELNEKIKQTKEKSKNKYINYRSKYIWLLKHLKKCKDCKIPENLIGSIL